MPEPVASVRVPHRAPAPKASCMSAPFLQSLLQFFLGGERVVPDLGHPGHRRTREMFVPPTLDDLVERVRRRPVFGQRYSVIHRGHSYETQRISTGKIATAWSPSTP